MSMTVVMLEPGKKARIVKMEKDLESMQKVVGGLIQAIYPFEDAVALVCNDEGKMIGLPANRGLYDSDGRLYDILCGTCFICGAPFTTGDFESLTEEQIKKYYEMFELPEIFCKVDGEIVSVKLNFCLDEDERDEER